jgi:hypothetical protein
VGLPQNPKHLFGDPQVPGFGPNNIISYGSGFCQIKFLKKLYKKFIPILCKIFFKKS